MNETFERTFRWKRVAFVGIIFVLLMAGSYISYIFIQHNSQPESAQLSPSAPLEEKELITMTPKPIEVSLSMVGKIQPGRIVQVISPLSGKVKENNVFFGAVVNKGQVLLTIDTQETEEQYHEAQKAFMAARLQVEEMINWPKNREVVESERSVRRSKLALEAQKREFENTKKLYNKNIVDKNEYESSKQSYLNQQLDLQSAEDEFQTLRTKFTEDDMVLANEEMQLAQSRMRDLGNLLTKSKILAPLSGMILQPSQSGENENGAGHRIERGVPFQQGQYLLSIGDLTYYSVSLLVDEIDIAKLRIEQKVKITGDGFSGMELAGKISSIAPYATGDLSDPEIPSKFETIVTLDPLTPGQKKIVRVGMSANIEVTIYENQEALLAPLSAVGSKNGRFLVKKKNGQKIEIMTGYTTIVGQVEIVSGVNKGTEIWNQFQEQGSSM